MTESSSLLPPFELSSSLCSAEVASALQVLPNQAHPKKLCSPSLEFVSPFCCQPVKKKKSEAFLSLWDGDDETTLVKFEDNLHNSSSTTTFIDLSIQSTPLKKEIEVIDLLTPSPVKKENLKVHQLATAQMMKSTRSVSERTIKTVESSVQLHNV